MVIIRLARGGAKKRPFYHVVVSNSREARDGRFIERLGFYNPIAAGSEIKLQLNQERIDYWTSKGAQLSERISHLIKNFAEISMETEEDRAAKRTERKKLKEKQAKAKVMAEEKAAAEAKPAEAAPAPGEEKPKEPGKPAKEKPEEPEPKKLAETPEEAPAEEKTPEPEPEPEKPVEEKVSEPEKT